MLLHFAVVARGELPLSFRQFDGAATLAQAAEKIGVEDGGKVVAIVTLAFVDFEQETLYRALSALDRNCQNQVRELFKTLLERAFVAGQRYEAGDREHIFVPPRN